VYSDITIDAEVIHTLPKNVSVLEHIRRIAEEVEVAVAGPVTAEPVAAEPVAAEPAAVEPVAAEPVAVDSVPAGGLLNIDDKDDDLDFDEQINGSDQGGATGQVIGEMGLQREFVTQPIDVQENSLIDKQLHCQILQVAPAGSPISDYHTSNIQPLGSPTLFPYGVGDFYNQDCPVNSVPMKDVSRHQFFYCIAREDGTFHTGCKKPGSVTAFSNQKPWC
jgi:hypothetical protein